MSPEEQKRVFDEFDSDDNGYIDQKDLMKVLAQCGIESEDDQKAIANKILSDADTDGDRKITWEEFKAGLA